ncbi:type VI secretion system-associated FHA domain protein TagH [Belnapia rosea]|uniref:type VI secretion system-associated FHA domain protein TagH n=1 Tax=Belnapia rosea TaxID=938405 RepID=UPI00088133B9|nr:type VI secretion system-associated FHA domain protein TagH [Belnapia rosea]SDB68283.1 FHA domain protein [Belnapia rosea]
MSLTLNVLRCPDAAVPESRHSSGGDLTIGRGLECDWMLQDPERVLSKRHCVLEFRGGFWQVRDLSTNGTFLNHAATPIGRDLVASLSNGDRLRLGSYEIEVRIGAAETQGFGAAPAWGGPPSAGMGRAVPDPFADPFAPPPAAGPSPGFATPPLPTTGVALPDDFDPFGDEPPMPDHRPAASDAFAPPRPVAPAAPLPDDWDLDFDLAPQAAARPAAPPPAAPRPPAWTPPPVASPAVPSPVDATEPADPFAEDGVPSIAIPAPLPAAAPPPPAAPVAAIAPDAALALLLQGAGLPPSALAGADPAATLLAAGASLRAAVAGLRALLIARADVKREFRIEQTMLRAAGNNPLKFAATDDAALAALLGPKPAVKAVEETVNDLNAHQVASLAATQAAARALLDRLAPAGLEAQDKGGGFLGAKEKRLWEAYKVLHAQLLDQFEDDFDSAFGKAFARAYEEASRKDGGR